MSETQHNNYPRFRARYGDPTEELHSAYNSWLDDMSHRPDAQFVPIEFDTVRYPEQSIYVPKMDAHDPHPRAPDFLYYGGVKRKMVRAMGAYSFNKLSHQFTKQTASTEGSELLTERLISDRREGKNTMLVTSHYDFTEVGLNRGFHFLGKKDRANNDSNRVLLNKLMTRQTFMGKKIVEHFIPLSGVYFSYPKSASAEQHGVPIEATNLGNALFKKVLKPDLEKGGIEMDIALTGKQIVPIRLESGELHHYEIPPVDPASAKLVECFDNVVAATIINSPVTGSYEMDIGEVLDVQELLKTRTPYEIVDSIYEGITHSVEEFTGKDVEYHSLKAQLGKQAIENGF